MAITPTGAIYKALSFDNVSSRTYGVYITGQAVYNAPTRDVEMISIPGRNGAFALDKGRFENIEVSYPAGIFADNETDFAEAISDFRNFLCSRNGYVRLSDEYNPNEYRMAIYKSGLEVTPAQLKAGEFEIVFDCKPQRWLTSGETAVTIGEWGETETVSGDIVSVENPNGILAVKSLEVDIEPIQSGSGDPSPSNVRPISGWDDVVVVRTGENLVSENAILEGYQYNSSGVLEVNSSRLSIDRIKCVGNRYVSISWKSTTATSKAIRCLWDKYGNLLVRGIPTETSLGNNRYGYVQDLSSYPTAEYIGFTLYCTDSADANTVTSEYMVSAPSTSTIVSDFKPYGDTYTTALGTTVYGGTLDVTTGVLTVTHEIITFNGASAEQWEYYSVAQGNLFRHSQSDRESGPLINKEVYCNRFEVVDNTNRTNGTLSSPNSGGEKYFDFIYDDCNSVATWKTWLSSNNVQVVYPLATPQTYQLTAQQIELLTGDNSIWSSGGAITLEYGQDPSVLFNPTLFESSPMLEVEGYGIINLNEATIKISYVPLGRITLWDRRYYQITPSVEPVSYYTAFESEKVNAGDPLYYGLDTDTNSLAQLMARFYIADGYSFTETWALAGSGTLPVNTTQANVVTQQGHQRLQIFTTTAEVDFIVGTASSYSYTITYTGRIRENATQTLFASEIKFILTLTYDGSNNIQITAERQIITDEAGVIYLDIGQSIGYQIGFNRLEAGSTVLAIGNPTYIDCDLGEAYMIKDGSVISLNQYIDLGSDLPILSSGANTVTFDNTVTDLKIMPRWWKV